MKDQPLRKFYVVAGLALVALGVAISPLPGPGGLPVVMVGTVVVLRHSPPMRRRWVRARKRWPRMFGPLDNLLRRLRRKAPRVAPKE